MIIPKQVAAHIQEWRDNKIILNKERIQLIEYLEKYIFPREDLYFDIEMYENYIEFTEKFYFKLQPFQLFLTAFFFLYTVEDKENYYDEFLIMMARGGGKNGLVSSLIHFFISELHGVKNYNVSLVANSEKQAKTSFNEIYECIQSHELSDFFYAKKTDITGIDTNSVFQFHTSNANTKDGLRDGCVVYDEIHQYQNSETVNVFSSGLGKIKNAREIFIGTDGYVRDGFLDKFKERAAVVLRGEEPDARLFPFICKIDDEKEMDDESTWEKAQPMFHKPLSAYAKGLLKKVRLQYKKLETEPSMREEFITKRMNLPQVSLEKIVAPYEQVKAASLKELPNLKNYECIGGLDYASIKDFAAVGLLFRVDGNYYWKTHSFARKGFLDYAKLKPPIYEWQDMGLLTIVDEPSIDPRHIVNWFEKQREQYGLLKVVADNFRMDLLRPLFEKTGIEIEVIKNPRAIHSLLAPRIEDAFANGRIAWGNNPLMNWYTNNVAVKILADGNKQFLKKDEFRRKIDGFMAFVHAMYRADELLDIDMAQTLDVLADLDF